MRITRLAAIPLLLALAACGSSPAAPSPRCRRYALRYTENGAPGHCELALGRVSLDCYAGGTRSSWEYASLNDFVIEAQVPNLVLARQKAWSGGGPMLISASTRTTTNTYEGLRVLTRVRTDNSGYGSLRMIDSVRYDHWDTFGRPTAGRITRGETTEALTLDYDDAARIVQLSNGEYTVQDKNGNVVEQLEFAGGSRRLFVIQELAEVCE